MFAHEERLGRCTKLKVFLRIDLAAGDPLAWWSCTAWDPSDDRHALIYTPADNAECIVPATQLPATLQSLLTHLEGYLTPVV